MKTYIWMIREIAFAIQAESKDDALVKMRIAEPHIDFSSVAPVVVESNTPFKIVGKKVE